MKSVKTKTRMLGPLPIKRREGFTLIENLVAIVLIATGILGFSINTIGVIRGNYISHNVTIATNLAQDKMEELIGQTNPADGSDGPLNSQGLASPSGFDRSWEVIPDPGKPGLSQIDVTVFWKDYIDHDVKLSTRVYRP